jgi:hypothetical protein
MAEMGIPLETKIVVVFLCAAAFFLLAAWELVSKWLNLFTRSLLKYTLSLPNLSAKGFVRNGITPPIKPRSWQTL